MNIVWIPRHGPALRWVGTPGDDLFKVPEARLPLQPGMEMLGGGGWDDLRFVLDPATPITDAHFAAAQGFSGLRLFGSGALYATLGGAAEDASGGKLRVGSPPMRRRWRSTVPP
jgi:hypothetical protein